jgi:hypothetical protein
MKFRRRSWSPQEFHSGFWIDAYLIRIFIEYQGESLTLNILYDTIRKGIFIINKEGWSGTGGRAARPPLARIY